MYRLVLVDDELDIREGLREVIRFEELGFEVTGEYGNGLDALQDCERARPDLVITDIRMPIMDGLTMCREMRRLLPTVHFIVLSGYDDFEYARQALDVGSIGYILKPISSQEFTDMLKTARGKMDAEFEKRRDHEALCRLFTESLPMLREAMLSSLLTGGVSPSCALASAPRYGIDLAGPCFMLALIRAREEGGGKIGDPELFTVAALSVARETLEGRFRTQLFHYNGLPAALFSLSAPREADAVVEALEEARKRIARYLSARVLIGVGAPCGDIAQLPACARQALSALDQSGILEGDQVLCALDLEPGCRTVLACDPQALRALSGALKLCDRAACEDAVGRLVDACLRARPAPGVYRAYMMDVAVALLHVGRDMELDAPEDSRAFEELTRGLLSAPELSRAQAMLLSYCDQLMGRIEETRATGGRQLVEDALSLLHAGFARQEMSLEEVCRQLHISPSYFGVVFKRETRKTFHQYLTEVRMDRAMTLLAGGGMKTAEVAQAVGIPDPSYFSYAFKKHFRLSPSQARRGQEEKNERP